MSDSFPTVGIIGAGQLARMCVPPAIDLGINLLLLARSSNESGAQIAKHVVGDYAEVETVLEFAKNCDVVTFEHELIPLNVIKALEDAGVVVRPSSTAFVYSQDKSAMRQRLSNFPAPKSSVVTGTSGIDGYPLIAKVISGGYDGRGVWKIGSQNELSDLIAEVGAVLIEELIDFDYEIAVMVARSPSGEATSWAPTQTVQADGICTMTITPAPQLNLEMSARAQGLALKIAQEIGIVGVMAVEMFVKGDELFINELGMRPHNSGHWTIDGSVTSQFEQHLRAVLDLPLGDTSMRAPVAVMGNILGSNSANADRSYIHLMERNPALKFHNYMKEVHPGRKIGHLTLLGNLVVELAQEVKHAIDYMSGEVDE